ncbi:uncharacterized protein LOC143690707 [Tamandua tetradactyla]|uniref:uncharacterized protein LOC143690707 n=1 Tax=Tamandua tetradactyla TaxID=48850 RepID=UPI00405457E8
MTYDIEVVTVINGNLSEVITIQHILSLQAPSDIHEGKVTATSIEILWDRADGNFQDYEITCVNCVVAFMVQKVVQETATFSNVNPATACTFSIRTEKEGFKDSTPNTKEIQTGISDLDCNELFY